MYKLFLALFAILFLSQSVNAAEIFKCQVNNRTIFQNTPCAESYDYGMENHETFDGWKYGMNIIAFKKQAKSRQLPTSPGQNLYLSKYNDKIINSKADARIYSYRSSVAGKNTKVILFFTQKTQRLYKVSASLYLSQLPAEEKKYFYDGLVKQLSKKYGSYIEVKDYPRNTNLIAKNILKDMVGTEKVWGAKSNNIVSLTGNSRQAFVYNLNYKYLPLIELNIKETTDEIQKITDKKLKLDSGKF